MQHGEWSVAATRGLVVGSHFVSEVKSKVTFVYNFSIALLIRIAQRLVSFIAFGLAFLMPLL